MSRQASQVLEDALQLSPTERAEVVERLLVSLDRPDVQMDALWAQEAEELIAAYDAGQMQAFPADEVLAELEP
jgi:putative addiction module component (TIGR02574 family)